MTTGIAKVAKIIVRLVAFLGCLFFWLLYAYATLDRSDKALQATGGDPMPGRYSFLVLLIIILFFFRSSIFTKRINIPSIVSKIFAGLLALFALLVFAVGA